MNPKIQADFVRAQITVLLARHPELSEDEEALTMSLASETDAEELIARLVTRVQETKAQAKGLKDYMADLSDRADAYERRVEAMRALVFSILDAAHISKVELPIATISIRPGVKKIIITDESVIPGQFMRVKSEPDKTRIREWIDTGNPVPGAFLSNAEPVLNIRIK
jgi:hypothetical protein